MREPFLFFRSFLTLFALLLLSPSLPFPMAHPALVVCLSGAHLCLVVRLDPAKVEQVADHAGLQVQVERRPTRQRGREIDLYEPRPQGAVEHDVEPEELEAVLFVRDEHFHNPVMLTESISGLNINQNGIYVDATFGGGGHSKEILKKLNNQPPPLIVLHGKTGVGKTLILKNLPDHLDLEGVAQHRSSLFGGIHKMPRNQVQYLLSL